MEKYLYKGKNEEETLNQALEELKLISNIFWGAKVLSVRHTGEKIPIGTKRLTTLPSEVKVLDTHGSGAIVSILENRGKRYLLIVNRSLKDIMQCTFLRILQ